MKTYCVFVECKNKKVSTNVYYVKEEDAKRHQSNLEEFIDNTLSRKFVNSLNDVKEVIQFICDTNTINTSLYKVLMTRPFVHDKWKQALKSFIAASKLVFDSVEFSIKYPSFEVGAFDNDLLCLLFMNQDPSGTSIQTFEITQDPEFFTVQKI